MIVGTEWLIEAAGCKAEKLRDVEALQSVFAQIIADLGLKTIGEPAWHKFAGEGGITGLVMLTESHLACHTYPEYEIATFNLYCCRERPEWDWEGNLRKSLQATDIKITKIPRGKNFQINAAKASFPNVKFSELKIRERGRLPHWEKEDGIYFVTFRLADSLPQEALQEIEAEREQTLKILGSLERELSIAEKNKIDWLFSEKVDEFLDKGFGECYLKNSEIADVAAESLKHFDGSRYHLYAWCVMPNHVHIVFRIIQNNELEEILHSWKSYTANKINRILNREGRFWQREYYDHLVRNQEEFERIIDYVLNNPVKANLKNWKWVEGFGKHNRAAAL